MNLLEIINVDFNVTPILSQDQTTDNETAHMIQNKCAYTVFVGNPERKKPLGRSRNRRKRNIKLDFKNRMGWCRLDSAVSGQGQSASSSEQSNKLLGSIKCWELLEKLSNYQLRRKDPVPWS
jgi:hypothetical protein